MLCRELPSCPGGHADHQRHRELSAGHVGDGRSVVEYLVQGEQAEVDRHDLHDRSHAGESRSDAGTDERGLGKRCVTDAFWSELGEQAQTHGVGTAVTADVLTHQEDARIALHGVAYGRAHCLAIGAVHGGCSDMRRCARG